MELNLTKFLALLSPGFFVANADRWNDLENSERNDQSGNPNDCIPMPNAPGRCASFPYENSRPLINPINCVTPFKYNDIDNTCYYDKEADFFQDYIKFNECMFGKFQDRKCPQLKLNENVSSTDNLKEVCAFEKKLGIPFKQKLENVERFFNTGRKIQLRSGKKLEFFYNKNLEDSNNFENEGRAIITKFNLCRDFFLHSLDEYEQKYMNQIEKWCIFKTLSDYYYFYDSFKEKVNVLRFDKEEVVNAYKAMKREYNEPSKNFLRVYIESNENKGKPFEAAFKILFFDPEDEKAVDNEYCYDP